MNKREMTLEDVPCVAAIAASIMPFAWSEAVFEDCFGRGYCNTLLLEEGEIVGFLVLHVFVGECQILNVGIADDYQRRGLGCLFLQEEMRALEEKGVSSFWLEVRASNEAGIALYRRLGFVEVTTRVDYYPAEDGKEDAIIMSYTHLDLQL